LNFSEKKEPSSVCVAMSDLVL